VTSKKYSANNISIDGVNIGVDYPPYIVAELSANHNGDLQRALNTIDMAKHCGANAIKLQTYTADTITIDCDSDDFKVDGGLWDGHTLHSLYKWAHTPFEWHKELFEHARKVGITCFSTPFDNSAVDLLEDLNAPAYKIASFEVIDLPLIRYVAQTKKPMIISTGMANIDEINEALDTAYQNGARDIILLHCVSGYPVPMEQSNLKTIADISERFGVVSGLSDHTLGITAALTSIALGAALIEKHVTMSRKEKGPDSEFSIEPDELKKLCETSKLAWSSLGTAGYEKKEIEEENIKYRRSIYVVKNMEVGDVFNSSNIRSIRPGFGLKPKHMDEVLGKVAKISIPRGTALGWAHIK